RARRRWGAESRPVMSDGAGRFEIRDLADRNYTVLATRPSGGTGRAREVRVGSDITLAIESQTLASGRVVGPDGTPLSEYTLRIDHHEERFVRSERVRSPDGAFSIPDIPPGVLRIEADAEGSRGAVEFRLGDGETRSDLEIVIESNATVSGYVEDVDTGQPVKDLRVSVASVWDDTTLWRGGRRARTEADGSFTVTGVAPGLVSVVVYDRDGIGYGSSRVRMLVESGIPQDVGRVLVARARVDSVAEAGLMGISLDISDAAMERGDPLRLNSVSANSGAAHAGLRAGDVIVSLDGVDVTGRNTSLFRTLSRKAAGETLQVGLADGRVVAVELRPRAQVN
ncbi:MAG: PDZ domain-containing protein, partial [Myxococcota bacterium]